jgi:hypothetical protein
MVETSSPSRWGCCRSSGRRQRSEAGARIPPVGGCCRKVARAITKHRFGLWAVDGATPKLGTRRSSLAYTIHMKRTNLVLDADLLDQATRVLGVKTYSAAVNLALKEILRVKKIESLPQFFGQGLWEGNLSEMREDHPRRSARKSGGRKKGRA